MVQKIFSRSFHIRPLHVETKHNDQTKRRNEPTNERGSLLFINQQQWKN